MDNTKICQELLLTWMSLKDKVSYDTIKRHCEYLNLQYCLSIEEHPAWQIFLPLFSAGNVDFCGDSYFKITEPILVTKNKYFIYTNVLNQPENVKTRFPFIFRSIYAPNIEFSKTYRFNAVSSLQHFPSIDNIVGQFEALSLNDFSSLTFDSKNVKYGVAKRENIDLSYYFVYPNTRRIVAIPYWNVDPDGKNIAYCYSRAIDGRGNGVYYEQQNLLKVISFRFPTMLYRILMLESLLEGAMPSLKHGMFEFPDIDKNIIIELNRILCNSIRYE